MKILLKALPFLLISVLAQAAYEDHFPTYFEYCSGTRWQLQNGEPGGSPGHGFTYIHGLCKDYRSAYPQVIPCSEVSAELREKYPHKGVGISLDKNFSNVMWVAVPGRDLMIFGDSKPKAISNADVRKHIARITELKVFDKVISKGDMLKGLTPGTPEYLYNIADETLGTDHAVNWARELHCVKIPAKKESLSAVAAFLNKSNNQYKQGKGYEWSKFSNNCVHLSINQAHAMGLTDSIKVDQKFIRMLGNIALPANAFLMFADEAVLAKMPSNKLLKEVLPQRGMYRSQVGSIMQAYHAFPSGEKFNTDNVKVLTAWRVKKPHKLLATPRGYEKKRFTPSNSTLKANAELWVERYTSLIADLKKSERGTAIERYLQKQLDLSQKILSSEK